MEDLSRRRSSGAEGSETNLSHPPSCPHLQLQLCGLKIGQARRAVSAGLLRVPDPGMGTLIPGPTPGPTCIWMELRYARPRPAQRGPLGSHPARGQACPGSVALQFSGEAAQSGSSSAGTRVMGALPQSYRSRPAPPAPHPLRGAAPPAGRERRRTTGTIPRKIAAHPFLFFSSTFL